MKPVIVGIIPASQLFKKECPYDDFYKVINMYPKQIFESGAIPIGVMMHDGQVNEQALALCDAFIIQGGNCVYPYIYEVIYYAIRTNKPLLGICLGSQALAIFSAIYEQMDRDRVYQIEEILAIYQKLKQEYDGTLLKHLDPPHIHDQEKLITRTTITQYEHPISLIPGSRLSAIYQCDQMDVVSLHGFDYKYIGSDFEVTAVAPDGVAEAIEYKDPNYFIVGTHFHPEIRENDHRIFEMLIKEAMKRK